MKRWTSPSLKRWRSPSLKRSEERILPWRRVEESIIEEMDDSILAKFPDDEASSPLPRQPAPRDPRRRGAKARWFQRTFASACKACREAVKRVSSTRAVLTKEERSRVKDPEQKRLEDDEFLRVFTDSEDEWPDTTPLDVAVVEGGGGSGDADMRQDDRRDGPGCTTHLVGAFVAARSALCQVLTRNGCPWDKRTCSGAARASGSAAVGASERVPVGRDDVREGGEGRASGDVAVGA